MEGDYFTGGGKMPWWLSGISHHMSGYSAAVFVAFAATVLRALVAVVAAFVALLEVPLRAARARSAMASPTCKMGARRGAAHSRGWQEYGTYAPATNMPHEIAIIRGAQTTCHG